MPYTFMVITCLTNAILCLIYTKYSDNMIQITIGGFASVFFIMIGILTFSKLINIQKILKTVN